MRHALRAAFCATALAAGFELSALEPAATAVHYEKDASGRLAAVTTKEGTTRYSYFDGFEEPFLREVLRPDGTKEEFSLEVARAVPSFFTPPQTGDPLSQSHNRFLFTGYEWEPELKLYFTPSGRFYDPTFGRFVQQDSHLGDAARPPSLHRYTYGHSNPTTFIDPSGHEAAIVTQASLDPKVRQRLEEQAANTGYNAAWATGAVVQTGVETGKAVVNLATFAMDEQAQMEAVQRGAASLKRNAPTISRALEGNPLAQAELLAGMVEPRIEAYKRGVDEYAAAQGPVARGRSAVRTTFPEGSAIAMAASPFLGRAARSIEGLVVEGRGGAELVPAVAEAPTSASTLPKSLPPPRPSWQFAEADSAADLAEFGFKRQPSYLGGKQVPYGTPGSVRPDLASENLKLAVDVKNYDVTTAQGRHRLVKDIVGQTGPRASNLPEGMRQAVIIDIRQQQISDSLLNRMIDRIVKQSEGAIKPENIHVRR